MEISLNGQDKVNIHLIQFCVTFKRIGVMHPKKFYACTPVRSAKGKTIIVAVDVILLAIGIITLAAIFRV